MDVVLMFPGQGSQKPGMGRDLSEAFPTARDVFAAADEALGESLSSLCWEGPAETLTLTSNAQPALLTHGAAAWAVIREAVDGRVRAAAGHSLGEFTAYHATGALPLAAAVRLVRARGVLMQRAGEARPGAMAAILGDLTEPIESICARASADPRGGVVVPANYNTPGQVVISGEVAGVELAMTLCKEVGGRRAMRLSVSGAFHSPLMRPAAEGLASALANAHFAAPMQPVYANVTADSVTDADSAERLCLEQLTAPVRWSALVLRLVADFPDALFVEVGPGTVLAGLVRKIAPAVTTAPCGTAADIDHLLEKLA
ncbi:MAG: ACP S-malonyltransferase [Gemmatimonadota bacterium]